MVDVNEPDSASLQRQFLEKNTHLWECKMSEFLEQFDLPGSHRNESLPDVKFRVVGLFLVVKVRKFQNLGGFRCVFFFNMLFFTQLPFLKCTLSHDVTTISVCWFFESH